MELSETRYIIPRKAGKPPLENSKTRTYPYLLKLSQTRYIIPYIGQVCQESGDEPEYIKTEVGLNKIIYQERKSTPR